MARKSRQQRKALERDARQSRAQSEFQRAQKAGGSKTDTQNRGRLISRLVDHGATRVEIRELFKESQVIWQIRPDHELSDTCVQLEEFMSSAARNAQSALHVIERMGGSDNRQDRDLITALKKYVEDSCEAIKVADNKLKDNGSSLESLLFEIPDDTLDDEVSWRNLIGRRDVIAHRLLTVDDNRVYVEAVRDFGLLHQLLSKVYFAPVKTSFASSQGFMPFFKANILTRLAPSRPGDTPSIGQSLIFVCEDADEGFLSFRMGRSIDNTLLLTSSRTGTFRFSLYRLNNLP